MPRGRIASNCKVGTILVFGALYYVIAVRGSAKDAETEADAVTGEAVIG